MPSKNVADVWLGLIIFEKSSFCICSWGGGLGGSWVVGLGLDILPKAIAFFNKSQPDRSHLTPIHGGVLGRISGINKVGCCLSSQMSAT
jgi:hypothetical protein